MANVDVTRIAGNIGALNALNSLQSINKQLAMHQTRLSSGKRINSAADDPAGLTIASKMLARSEGMKVAIDNINDASNLLSVAEGGLSKMNDILVQMRNKAEQAASDTLGTTERQAIQTQLSSYAEQIDNIVNETKWNGTKLLDGTVNKQFQTGADSGEITNWSLSQNHGAGTTGLGIATNVANNTLTAGVQNGVVQTEAATQTTASYLSALQTGNYQILGVGAATSTGIGKIVTGGTIATGFTLSATAPAAGTNEVANGNNNISIRAFTAVAGGTSTIDYSLDGGSTWSGVVNMSGNVAAGTVTLNLQNGGGNSGLTLTIAQNTGTTVAQQNTTIDYIKMGYAKMQLQTADGTAVTVNNGGNASAYFYLDGAAAGNQVDTGRGLTVNSETWSNMNSAAGSKAYFTYSAKNAYSVNVSTATLAANYMSTVQTAMDTVNKSMSDLGSLMARMNFKADAVATAQVNVEASYNRIMNANMAEEQMNASKYSILQQTGVAMLAQANQAPQSLLSLFR